MGVFLSTTILVNGKNESPQLITTAVKASSIQKANVFNDNLTKITTGSLVCCSFELYGLSNSARKLLAKHGQHSQL